MAQNSKIGWTDDTVNFWWGCTEAGAECDNCYARTLDKMRGPLMDKANKTTHWGHDAPRWIRTEAALLDLARSNRAAEKEGRPRRVFINSMSDIFEKRDDLDAPRAALWEAIPKYPMLRFLLLTKRPANITHQMVPEKWFHKLGGFPKNVAIGTTVGNKRAVTARAAQLINLHGYAHTLFFSIEPMLEPLSMEFYNLVSRLDRSVREKMWLLVGGESGSGARPFDVRAAEHLRELAEFGGMHFFMKQMGSRYVLDGKESEFTPNDHRSKMEDFTEKLRLQQVPPALS